MRRSLESGHLVALGGIKGAVGPILFVQKRSRGGAGCVSGVSQISPSVDRSALKKTESENTGKWMIPESILSHVTCTQKERRK